MHSARSSSHHRLMPTTLPGPPRSPALSSARTHRLRIICGLAIVWMLAACGAVETSRASPTASPTGAPTVDARAFAIYDEDAGRQLASSNADDRLPVGSLMKLLNAYVAYRAGEPQKAVVAPDGLGGADESVIDIRAGQAITRGVLIRAMLKVSANDAARLLALDIAGSEERYAEMMNDAAADLALVDTHAANATGLDADGQFSSANDLITLGTHLLRDATFRQTVSEPTANLNGQTFPNTNDLLGAYTGADGIKTGHTSDAGWCILASATREGRRIVVVVLGAPTEEGRDDAAQTLLDWGFAQPRQAESGTQPGLTDSGYEAPELDSDGRVDDVPPGRRNEPGLSTPPLALDLEWPASGRSAAANLGRAHHARPSGARRNALRIHE
jgi:D-alanyl-D-alanine carboxypeptidase